jgi:uncharacterized protein DUF4012
MALVTAVRTVRVPTVLRTPEARRATFYVAVAASAVLAAWVSDAEPTGIAALDELYVAALAGTVSFFAGTARRWTWFLPAGAAAVVAGDGVSAGLAAAAIALSFWSVLSDTRTRALAASVAGLGVAALQRTDAVGFHGSTALLTALAILPVLASGYRWAGRRVRRRTRRVALGLGILGGIVLAGAVLGGLSVSKDLTEGARLIDRGIVAARDADDEAAAARLGEAAHKLESAGTTLESWFVSPARALPFVGPNLQAVDELADDAGAIARVSSHAANAVDVDQLRFADGRLDPQLVRDVAARLGDIEESLETAQHAVDTVRSPWLVSFVADRMTDLDRQLADNQPDVESARKGAEVASELLAPGGTRRYLVLFTTPVEARGRTGFPGNYAELVVQDGKLSMPRFGRINELDTGGVPCDQRSLAAAGVLLEEFVARYGRFDPECSWRNLTMSPDFPTIALASSILYPQSGGAPIDGVMTVDPDGLAALMELTGPISDPRLDEPLTPENTAEFLHRDQYLTFAERDERIDFLETVARTTFDRLTSADLPSPEELVDIMSPVVDGGHIQFTTIDLNVTYFDEIGLAGHWAPTLGDFASVVTSNAGGSKIDLFLQRSLDYDVNWDPATGQLDGTLTATLTNEAPASGLPDYLIGNDAGLPWGTNRSFVSIYSMLPLDEARIDGEPAALQSENELERNVYSTFVDIPPGGTVTIELDLALTIPGDTYLLTLGHQPLVNAEEVAVTVDVAGDIPLDASGEDVHVDGRTVTWSGPLEEEVDLTVELDSG